MSDLTNVNPRIVKRFIYHIIEANRKHPPVSLKQERTRHVGEIFKHSYHHHTTDNEVRRLKRELEEAKQTISTLSKHVKKIQLQEQIDHLEQLYVSAKKQEHDDNKLHAIEKRINAIKNKLKGL